MTTQVKTQGLSIAEDLTLPIDTVTSRVGIFGISGSGKTHTGSVLDEEMLAAGAQTAFLDPLGVAWGLRGAGAYILGGDHADLPLDPGSGAEIADLIVDDRLTLVLDMSQFDDDDQKANFAASFARRLLARNRNPLHIFVDEADMFASQTPSTSAEFACRKAFDNVVRRGRVNGIGVTLMSQRPAVVAKNLLTQITMLVVHQLTGQTDKQAVDGWIKAHGDEAQRKAVLNSLPSLKPGNAWVWAPGGESPVFQRVQIRHRTTFDSSATPVFGSSAAACPEPQRLAGPQLEALRKRLAVTIEKAAADDPVRLREKIAVLEKQLRERAAEKGATPEKIIERVEVPVEVRVEVPVLLDADLQRATALADAMLATAKDLGSLGAEILTRLRAWEKSDIAAPLPVSHLPKAPAAQAITLAPGGGADDGAGEAPDDTSAPAAAAQQMPDQSSGGGGVLTAPQQRILDALASFAAVGVHVVAKHNVAAWAHASPTSSGYTNNLGSLRSAGLIKYPSGGFVSLTEAGAASANVPRKTIRSCGDLLDVWCERLPAPQARILRELKAIYPQSMSKEALAISAGASPTSSGYTNNLGALRSLGLINYPRPGTAAMTDLLFPKGLPR